MPPVFMEGRGAWDFPKTSPGVWCGKFEFRVVHEALEVMAKALEEVMAEAAASGDEVAGKALRDYYREKFGP